MDIQFVVRRLPRCFLAHGSAALVTTLVLIGLLRLWTVDLGIPLAYEGDGLFTAMCVKGLVENGWYLRNPALGAPGVLDLHDFPLTDGLHFVLLKALSLLGCKYAWTMNLYYLLTFPLTTCSALLVLRHFKVSFGPALLAGLLYAFLPYHFYRGVAHLMLAAYFLVPPLVLVVLWIYLDPEPADRECGPGSPGRWPWRARRTVASLLICLLVSSAGVYYAAFGAFFLLAAGAGAWWGQGRRSAGLAALVLVGVIVLGGLANLSPTLAYQWTHGKNTVAVHRPAGQVELFALKISQLLLPVANHRLPALAYWKARYERHITVVMNENQYSSLGVLGSAGFLLLLAPFFRRGLAAPSSRLLTALSFVNLCGLLLALPGSFGSFLANCGFVWLRAYNRISVYLAFLALFALTLGLEAVRRRWAQTRRGRVCFGAGLALLAGLGILDETGSPLPYPFGRSPEAYQAAFANDRRFVQAIESSLPAGASVFQLPYFSFPEGSSPRYPIDYEPFRAYLHSTRLRWSYGAMKGREADTWQQALSAKSPPALLLALREAGFAGIYLNRQALAALGQEGLESQLHDLLKVEPLVSEDQQLAFYPLREMTPTDPVRSIAPTPIAHRTSDEDLQLRRIGFSGRPARD
jgi:phosphoglycerol transferase